jgi:NTE family protein
VSAPIDPTVSNEPDRVEEGIALCLSGGGYRAMVFHLGVLWRLNELGLLSKLDRVSSVSGGSITAALLGLRWKQLGFDAHGVATQLGAQVISPIRALANRTIDVFSVAVGLLPGTSIGRRIESAYRKHLFGETTLQDLPDDAEGPRFVINATSAQSGALWRFSRKYAADYRVGRIGAPTFPLARVVAASSAFPPFLSPVELDLADQKWFDGEGDPALAALRRRAVLTDGGVYDNLGLETAWKRYRTILISDAGGILSSETDPRRDWPRHAVRTLFLVDHQVRSLRKRLAVEAFVRGDRAGAYFGIRTDIASYPVGDPLPVDRKRAIELADMPTRLAALTDADQMRLVNWGYAVSDAALRAYVVNAAARPPRLPYPGQPI